MERILVVMLCGILLYGCGKQSVKIGEEEPEQEIEKCLQLSKKKAYDKAVECLEIFKSRFAEDRWGQTAELEIADAYFRKREYLLAADAYTSFVKLYPNHPQVDYVLFRTGISYARHAPKAIDRDQKYLLKSLEQFELILRAFPASTYYEAVEKELKAARGKLAQRLFYIGRFYYRTKEYIAARGRLETLTEEYPDSELVPKALYYLVIANLGLKENERGREALEKLVLNYPKNVWTKKAEGKYLGAIKK